jgi:hypothetical protein
VQIAELFGGITDRILITVYFAFRFATMRLSGSAPAFFPGARHSDIDLASLKQFYKN